MRWRPEGDKWDEAPEHYNEEHYCDCDICTQWESHEVGADAMLDAVVALLRERANDIQAGYNLHPFSDNQDCLILKDAYKSLAEELEKESTS